MPDSQRLIDYSEGYGSWETMTPKRHIKILLWGLHYWARKWDKLARRLRNGKSKA